MEVIPFAVVRGAVNLDLQTTFSSADKIKSVLRRALQRHVAPGTLLDLVDNAVMAGRVSGAMNHVCLPSLPKEYKGSQSQKGLGIENSLTR